VAIARALLKNAPLLIFDEATSEVDAQTDAAIHHALYEVCKGRTVLIIAHRLSTVIRAHRIVVLEGGRVVDTGTHYELMGRCGAYSRLCEAHLVPQPGGRRVR
jgi:ABC-type multidrug transport system fused ATPase/permease subunit